MLTTSSHSRAPSAAVVLAHVSLSDTIGYSLGSAKLGLLLAVVVVSFACTEPQYQSQTSAMASGSVVPQHIELANKADSVAMRAFEAFGGPAAWAQIPNLRFDFVVERDGNTAFKRSHLWDRRNGRYRVEYEAGADSTAVVLFDTDTREGTAYINGQAVADTANADLVEGGYHAYLNDIYWLMMPTKLFDEGVSRSIDADSSDASTDVVHLTFDGVGYTPDDRYWVFVDKATGRVKRWTFILQGRDQARTSEWTDYESRTFDGQTIHFAVTKRGASSAILTNQVDVPMQVEDEMFTSPMPML